MIRRLAAACGLTLALGASGDDTRVADEIAKYREMLEEGNPAELMEMRGEELWNLPRGPANRSMGACDLGLGPGKIEGAYAQLPRYFADSGRVEDVESRLVTCMTALQGLTREDALQGWTRPGSDIEALVTYVAAQSRGHPIAIPTSRPEERRMIDLGEAFFFRRSGPLDFSCATCHSGDDRRIRLQDLPNFHRPDSARASLVTWPAYRVSQSAVWTLERRLIDCIRQMRNPEPAFGSEAIVALQSWLQHQAAGGVLKAPGIKR